MAPPATDPLAAGRLGVTGVAFYALAATTPTAVAGVAIPAAYARGDLRQIPLTFAVAGVILLLFTVGLGAMVRRAPTAGGIWALVARGLGRPIGVGAAGVTLLAYTALQTGLYAATGAAAAPLLRGWLGVTVDWWVVAGSCWLIVALGGLLRVDLAGALLALIVIAEIAVVGGFAAANLLDPAPGGITWDTLVPDTSAGPPAWGLLLVIAVAGFAGFETTVAYAEEAARPRRTIRLATALAALTLAVLYAVSAWATSVATGPDLVTALSAGRGPELMFDLAGARLAPWAVTLGRVLLLTGLLAALISLHHTVARYTYALGRERILLPVLGRTTRRWSVPLPASLAASLGSAAALAGVYFALWSPADTVRWLTAAGALGILLLMLAASVSALLFLNRVPDDESAWRRFAAPAAAVVLLGALTYLAGADLPALLGDLAYVVPGAYAVVLLIGIGWAYLRKAVDPIAYAGIGLGGAAVVVAPAIPSQRQPGAHRPERIQN